MLAAMCTVLADTKHLMCVTSLKRLFLLLCQVVAGDPFNSDPDDPEVQSDEVRRRKQRGDELPVSDLGMLRAQEGRAASDAQDASAATARQPLQTGCSRA